MKITEIEIHKIHAPLQAWNRNALKLYRGATADTRTIVVLHTDTGLQGLGEIGGPTDDEALKLELEQLRGTNPCR